MAASFFLSRPVAGESSWGPTLSGATSRDISIVARTSIVRKKKTVPIPNMARFNPSETSGGIFDPNSIKAISSHDLIFVNSFHGETG